MIDETAEEIREMQTHSSSVVAVKAARALEALCDREHATVEEYLVALQRNSDALRRASPSHASLQSTQRDIVDAVEAASPDTIEEAKAATREAVADVVDRVENAKQAAAANAADRLADGDTLLTHDYSTTVLAAIERAVADGADLEVYVTEARPRVLGRKTARELGSLDGVDVHLIVDGACGAYVCECDRVLLGMTCVAGDTYYNRVGTYPVAATAADTGVPVTACGSSMKVVAEPFEFEAEHRPVSEVIREPAEGFTVENPAYDATPTRLLAEVVTERGVEEPS
ncbi:MAG: translation initiation factor eIF-2B [Halobacteriaceae archaeon]